MKKNIWECAMEMAEAEGDKPGGKVIPMPGAKPSPGQARPVMMMPAEIEVVIDQLSRMSKPPTDLIKRLVDAKGEK